MIIIKDHSFYDEWAENVKEHFEKNVPRDPSIPSELYYVHLCDDIENLFDSNVYEQLDQFGGVAAASLGVALTIDEYHFIEGEYGEVTKGFVGYFVLRKLAEETAEKMAFEEATFSYKEEGVSSLKDAPSSFL